MNAILHSVSVYASTSVYLTGVLAMVLVSAGDATLTFGILAFGLITITIALVAVFRETQKVHVLVNSQHDAMVERVNQLTAALLAGGIVVPQAKGTRDDRRDCVVPQTKRGRE